MPSRTQLGFVGAVIAIAIAAVQLQLQKDQHHARPDVLHNADKASSPANFNAGIAAMNEGNLELAATRFHLLNTLEPTNADVAVNLALALANLGECNQATHVLREHRRHYRESASSLSTRFTAPHKVAHDIEQLEHLQTLGASHANSIELLQSVLNELRRDGAQHQSSLIKLTPEQASKVAGARDASMNIPDKEQATDVPVLNAALNYDVFQEEFLEFGTVVLDDILTPETLDTLYNYFLEGTIWDEVKPWGYLGAYMDSGLSHPAIFKVGAELRSRFPAVFDGHYLRKVWAYKYTSGMKGINIHGDEAAINVNVWITPTNASLNPDNGGLVVFNESAPAAWSFDTFNSLHETQPGGRVDALLRETNYANVTIPYRQNRLVMFNSSLFHKTDDLSFARPYKSRRINLTFLFGRRSHQQNMRATTFYKEGNLHFTGGRMLEAIASYTEAMQDMPDFADCAFNRGAAYMQLQRIAEASADFAAAVNINPLHSDAYFQLGNTYLAQKQYDRALAQYKQAVAIHPQQSTILYNQGTCFVQLRKFKEAIQAYEAAIAIAPESSDAYANLAVAQFRSGDISGAEASCRALLRLNPRHPSAFNNLLSVLQKAPHSPRDAVSLCELSLRHTNSIEVCFSLVMICAERGNFESAEACLAAAEVSGIGGSTVVEQIQQTRDQLIHYKKPTK